MGLKPTKCFTQKHIQIKKCSQKEIILPKTQKRIHIPKTIVLRRNSQKYMQPLNLATIEKIIQKDQDLEKLDQLYEACLHQYGQHKIDKSYEISTEMYQKYDSIKKRFQENDQFLQKCKIKIQKIRKEYEQIKQVEEQIKKTKWNQSKKTKNCIITANYQKQTITTCFETELDVKFQILFQALSEIQLYTDLSSIVSEAKCIQSPAANCKIGHLLCKIPLLANRQSFFIVHVYDRLQHDGTILLLTRSLEKNQNLQKQYKFYPKHGDNSVAIVHKYIFVKCKPLKNGKVKVILTSCLDMQSSLIPKFALDWLIGTVSQQIYAKVHAIGKQYAGSKWELNSHKNQFLKKIKSKIDSQAHPTSRKSIK